MVRASATGAIDFARSDLKNKLWWRKLRWTLSALSKEDDYRLLEAQHLHWVTIFSNSDLDDDSFERSKANAQDNLNKLIALRYPQYAEQLRKQTFANTREGALAAYREKFGYPGDPRYEAMVKRTMEAFQRAAEVQEQNLAAMGS